MKTKNIFALLFVVAISMSVASCETGVSSSVESSLSSESSSTESSSESSSQASTSTGIIKPVKSVKFNQKNVAVECDKTVQLSHTTVPAAPTNPNVSYTSSDPLIAEVSLSGLVTGLSDGEVTITIETEDGGFESKCNLSVVTLTPQTIVGSSLHSESEYEQDLSYSVPKGKVVTASQASTKYCSGKYYNKYLATGLAENANDNIVTFTAPSAGTLVAYVVGNDTNVTISSNGSVIATKEAVTSNRMSSQFFTIPAQGTYELVGTGKLFIYYLNFITCSEREYSETLEIVGPDFDPNVVQEGAMFVSPDGLSTNSGTMSHPYNFTTAINKTMEGSIIYLLEGTYVSSQTLDIGTTKDGLPNSYMSLLVYPGADVLFDFSSQETDTALRGIKCNASYWYFYGFKVKGAGDNGILQCGNYCKFENIVTSECRDTGFQLSRASSSATTIAEWPHNNQIINCTSFNNYDPSGDGEDADGFASKLTTGNDNIFDGCLSYANSDDGWDLFTKGETGPIGSVILRNCAAYNNGSTLDNEFNSNGDCNGFKLGGNAINVAHYVINCVAFNNGNHGFTDNSNHGPIFMKNCTSFNNSRISGQKYNFDMNRSAKGTHRMINCLSYSDEATFGDQYGGTAAYSVFFNKASVFDPETELTSTVCSYYYFEEEATCNQASSSTIGTKLESNLTTAIFESTTLPTVDVNCHTALRNSDGSIHLGSFLKLNNTSTWYTFGENGTYIGAKFN